MISLPDVSTGQKALGEQGLFHTVYVGLSTVLGTWNVLAKCLWNDKSAKGAQLHLKVW